MANIFLSYDREDEERARPIAALVERVGHSVWWDRQIKGGREFGAEIEAALNAADKIVVLWSCRSIKSAWVRDEAAVGRDTGRLVPATIDGTPAPLGFRQFQTIDLSKWRGRGSSAEAQDLLDALSMATPPATTAESETKRLNRRLSRPLLLSGGILAMAAAAALVWQFWSPNGAGTPSFAIIPADSSSSSRQLAEEVATRVASFNDPSGTDFRVIDANSERLGGGYVLKVASGGEDLTLVSSQNNSIVWSSSLQSTQDSPDDLVQAVSVAAQRALSCAADALSYRREQIDQETLKLYLSSCTRFDEASGTNSIDTELMKGFGDVVARAPHFEPAWKKLFTVEADALYAPDRNDLIDAVRAHVRIAEKLGLDFGELYAVKASLFYPADFESVLRTLDSGIAKYPKSAILFRSRALRSTFVGRMNDAANYAGRAVTLDPLSAANLENFALTLAYAGDAQAGYEQLRKAEKLWPNAPTVTRARFSLDLRFGDPREALALYRKFQVQTVPNPGVVAFLQARIDPSPQNIERAIDVYRAIHRQSPGSISGLVQALGQFGRKDEAIEVLMTVPGGDIAGIAAVLFRPAMRDVWRNPRSIAAAAHLGLLAYWKESGNWPDFCFDPELPYDCKKEAARYSV